MTETSVLFLDESGDHSLTVIDPQYPMFVLGGVIVDRGYAEGEMDRLVRAFKQDLFGRDDLILHTADITRNRNGFERLKDPPFRERFYRELNRLMRGLRYTVVACAIRKDAHLARYGLGAVDPYLLSLDILVEQFCFEIGDRAGGGFIVAEKRNPTLDRELDVAWLNLRIGGTRHVRAALIEERITGLHTRPKDANIAGLQLADLIVSPIGRFVLGKRSHEDWTVIEREAPTAWGIISGRGAGGAADRGGRRIRPRPATQFPASGKSVTDGARPVQRRSR